MKIVLARGVVLPVTLRSIALDVRGGKGFFGEDLAGVVRHG